MGELIDLFRALAAFLEALPIEGASPLVSYRHIKCDRTGQLGPRVCPSGGTLAGPRFDVARFPRRTMRLGPRNLGHLVLSHHIEEMALPRECPPHVLPPPLLVRVSFRRRWN